VDHPLHPALTTLLGRTGRYRGRGVNHEGEEFEGTMELRALPGGRAVGLVSWAVGLGGTVFHAEESVVSPGPDGTPVLRIVSTNQPDSAHLVLHRETPRDGGTTLTFRMGDPAARDTFREEVHFDLWNDGDVTHRYSWGLPGGEFADRSGARMHREG
jgi:hypothetical protein